MATTYTDTQVNNLVINKLTKQECQSLQSLSETELYIVPETLDSVVIENSTNPVTSGAVYEAIQDIGGTINDGTTTFTKNNETIGTTSANQSDNKTITLPNDIVMCNLIENKALASYANPITRLKYIEDYGWVDMDRSNIQYNEGTGEWTGTFVSLDITEGEYYYDMDNDTVFVADENSEMQDVTSTVIIQDDANKLYCDTTTNMLYRYDGTNFIALTSNFSGSYNDLTEKPLSVENNKVKYTLSDGTTKLTLAQENDLKTVAFSGSYNDLTDKLQNATTSVAGLMSEDDKESAIHLKSITGAVTITSAADWYKICSFSLTWGTAAIFDIYLSGSWSNTNVGALKLSMIHNGSYHKIDYSYRGDYIKKVRLTSTAVVGYNAVVDVELYVENSSGNVTINNNIVIVGSFSGANLYNFSPRNTDNQVVTNSEQTITKLS